MKEKDQLVTELINNEGVCRTAPATPGLLNIDMSTKTLGWLVGARDGKNYKQTASIHVWIKFLALVELAS